MQILLHLTSFDLRKKLKCWNINRNDVNKKTKLFLLVLFFWLFSDVKYSSYFANCKSQICNYFYFLN